jgi:hypothetical protein
VQAPKTISLWVRWLEAPADGRQCMIGFLNRDNEAAIQIGFREDRLVVWNFGGNEVLGDDPPAPNWHHLAYTYDGTRHTLFVDGVQADTSTVASQAGAVTTTRLGAYTQTGEQFGGSIDDVRIYDRPLSAAEVRALTQGR